MLSDFIVNASILVAAVCIGNQIFRDTEMDLNSPLLLKVLAGMICGVLGILLMIYCVKIDKTTIVDLRHIAIVIAGTLGGTVSIVVSVITIGLFRILHYGINGSSIAALTLAILDGIGASIIFNLKLSVRKKWIWTISYFLIISSMVFYILLRGDLPRFFRTLFFFIITTIVSSTVIYMYMDYLQGVTRLFKTLKEESARDHLTGLNNVRQFDRIFNKMEQDVQHSHEPVSLLFLDIDFFKKVNDTYGHCEGDRVLAEIAKILCRTCRVCDIISRNGGEEFTVILKDCPAETAVEIAERIRCAIAEHEFILSNGEIIHVTTSIGISTYPDTVKEFMKMLEEADNALYKAKRTGRNKVVLQQ